MTGVGGVTKVVGGSKVFGGVLGAVMMMFVGLETETDFGVDGGSILLLSLSELVICGNLSVDSMSLATSDVELLFSPPNTLSNGAASLPPEWTDSDSAVLAVALRLGSVNAPLSRSLGDMRRSRGAAAVVDVAVVDDVIGSGKRSEAAASSIGR